MIHGKCKSVGFGDGGTRSLNVDVFHLLPDTETSPRMHVFFANKSGRKKFPTKTGVVPRSFLFERINFHCIPFLLFLLYLYFSFPFIPPFPLSLFLLPLSFLFGFNLSVTLKYEGTSHFRGRRRHERRTSRRI